MRRAFVVSSIVAGAAAYACTGSDPELSSSEPKEDAGSTDALTDTGAPNDAATDADARPRCDLDAAFGEPKPLSELNTPENEGKPRVTADELTIHFTRSVDGGQVVYAASRSSPEDAFGGARVVTIPTTYGAPAAPTFSDDLKLVVFNQMVPDAGFDLYLATRESPIQSFGGTAPVDGVNSPFNDSDPYLRADGLALYFSSNRTGDVRLYRTTRTSGGPFAALAEVGGPTPDDGGAQLLGGVVVSADEKEIFFKTGSEDIATARWLSPTELGPVEVLSAISSPAYDEPGSMSGDRCRLYIRSGRPGGAGGNDIWVAQRPPLP